MYYCNISVSGIGSETFCYLEIIKQQTAKVISSQTPAHLTLVTIFIFNGTCQLYYQRLLWLVFVVMRFTGYGEAVMS